MRITVNGAAYELASAPLTPLLHVLREELHITSPKRQLPTPSVQSSQHLHQFQQSNGLNISADGKALLPRMNHKAFGRLEVFTGFVKTSGGFGRAAALDFYRPAFAAWQLQKQINLCAA